MPLNEAIRSRTQSLVLTLNDHRFLLYTLLSTLAVSTAIGNALRTHSNFYSVAIYLSKSNRSVLILANFGFILVLLCGRVVQQIFFGALRPLEVERLYDRLWFFVTESLLAFTIFRDDFDIPFALMFAFLLFVKSFHWLASDRIEWMDQTPYPGPPSLFHLRVSTLFFILWSTDFAMFLFAVETTHSNGVGGMVLFASEYAILMASVLNTTAKYLLSSYDLRRASTRGGENAPPWDNKSVWVFYIELVTDFLKLTTYLVFFTVIITTYGLPLNIVRDVYITARSFITRLSALRRYQAATRNMDQRYPNATPEEMAAMSDRICIICREEMVLRVVEGDNATPAPASDGPNMTPKKLPCGHVFHFQCLRSWLERQQSCPTCRRPVLEPEPRPQQPQALQHGLRFPPQPGAVPQQRNPFGALQPAFPLPNNNNQGGWIGRWLLNPNHNGNAQQPHIPANQVQFVQPPGQPNGVAMNNAAPMQNVVVGQQQLPAHLVVQYYFLYDPRYYYAQRQQPVLVPPGPAQGPPTAPPPAQPLQPAPMFGGFFGPGGVWQPWAMDGRWFGQGQGQQPQLNPMNPPQPAQRPSPPPVPTTTPTATAPTSDPAPAPTLPSTSNPTPTPTSQPSQVDTPTGGGTQTPRDAAALASMRRAAAAGLAAPATPPVTLRAASTSAEEPVSSTSAASTSAVSFPSPPSPQTHASSPAPATPNTTPNSSAHEPDNSRLKIPMMIPVYDIPSSQTLRLQAQAQAQPSPTPARAPPTLHPGALPPQNPQPQPQPHLQPQSQPQPQLHSQPQSQHYPQVPLARAPLRRPPPQTPINQLPPVLTDAQLAVMDQLTRDAIDERLRVLGGISGAVTRCIDDLMRVRSILPAQAGPRPVPTPTPQPQTTFRQADASSIGLASALPTGLAGGAADPTLAVEVLEVPTENADNRSETSTEPPPVLLQDDTVDNNG